MNDTNTLSTLSITGSVDTPTMQNFNADMTLVDEAILKASNLHSLGVSPQLTISNVKANFEMAAFFQQTMPSYKSAINPLISFFKLPKKNEYINQIILFEKIEWNNHCIQLKYPLEINMQIIDGFWEGYYEDLDMYIVAPDAEQLKKDFQEEFFVMWQVYANEPDEKLTIKARDIKYKILNSIKGVFSED